MAIVVVSLVCHVMEGRMDCSSTLNLKTFHLSRQKILRSRTSEHNSSFENFQNVLLLMFVLVWAALSNSCCKILDLPLCGEEKSASATAAGQILEVGHHTFHCSTVTLLYFSRTKTSLEGIVQTAQEIISSQILKVEKLSETCWNHQPSNICEDSTLDGWTRVASIFCRLAKVPELAAIT